MRERKTSLLSDTRGLSTVEYIILIALIAVVGFTAWQNFGATVARKVGMSDAAIASLAVGGETPGGTSPGAGTGSSSSALLEGAGTGAGTGTGTGTGAGTGAGTGTGTGTGTDSDPAADIWGEGGALGRGDSTGALAVARGVADGAIDVVSGAADGVVAIAGGLWDVVTHPIDSATAAADAVSHAVMHPVDTATAAYDATATVVGGAIDAGSAMIDACTSGDGYACSRGVTNVVASVIPVGAAGNVARGAGAVRLGTNGASRLSVVARRADTSDIAPSRVIRRDVDGMDARDMIREGGDRREVVFTRDADGNGRLRTSGDMDGAAFPESETARAHNHPGAGDDPAWQNPSPADIDYVRETGGNHAIVHDRGVTVINERSHAGNDITNQIRDTATGEVTTSRYQNIRNVTRVDSNDVRISTDHNGQLRIDPLPDSAHPDYLPITVIRNERVGTELVPDPANNRWQLIEHNAGTDQRLPQTTPAPVSVPVPVPTPAPPLP